jgi:predicted transcriptional regulator
VSITLSADIEERVRELARQLGVNPAQYAEAAIRRRVEEDTRLRAEFRDAASDPVFMADVHEVEDAFVSADSETARLLDAG